MSFQAYLDNIEEKTGKTPRELVALAEAKGFGPGTKATPIVEWLAADFGLGRFSPLAGWPTPVLVVPGNHEFDRRDVDEARLGLRAHVGALGLRLLDDESVVLADAQGRRVRFVGSTRWCDFDAFGPSGRERAMRAGSYFQKVMQSSRHGEVFGVEAVRALALEQRAWLSGELARTGDWEATVVITHFAPSLKSADPRYGRQPGTASFCNDDEDLMSLDDVEFPADAFWIF